MASGASTSDLELDTALLRCVYQEKHAVRCLRPQGVVSCAREGLCWQRCGCSLVLAQEVESRAHPLVAFCLILRSQNAA